MRHLLAPLMALALVACSHSANDDGEIDRLRSEVAHLRTELDESSTTTTSTEVIGLRCFPEGPLFCTPELNTTTTLPGRLGEAQIAFTELVRTYCDMAPNPLGARFEARDESIVVTDGEGNQLLLDLEDRRVTPIDGPDGIIPQPYRSCSTHVFLGYSDH